MGLAQPDARTEDVGLRLRLIRPTGTEQAELCETLGRGLQVRGIRDGVGAGGQDLRNRRIGVGDRVGEDGVIRLRIAGGVRGEFRRQIGTEPRGECGSGDLCH